MQFIAEVPARAHLKQYNRRLMTMGRQPVMSWNDNEWSMYVTLNKVKRHARLNVLHYILQIEDRLKYILQFRNFLQDKLQNLYKQKDHGQIHKFCSVIQISIKIIILIFKKNIISIFCNILGLIVAYQPKVFKIIPTFTCLV